MTCLSLTVNYPQLENDDTTCNAWIHVYIYITTLELLNYRNWKVDTRILSPTVRFSLDTLTLPYWCLSCIQLWLLQSTPNADHHPNSNASCPWGGMEDHHVARPGPANVATQWYWIRRSCPKRTLENDQNAKDVRGTRCKDIKQNHIWYIYI